MQGLYAENLDVSYDDRQIIRQLDLELPQEKVIAIIGPNGCGKSTLLKTLTRILSPTAGKVVLDGKDIRKENTKVLAQKMAILPQSPEITSGLTVSELVSYGRFPYQKGFGQLKDKDKEVIDWALEVTGTKDFADRPLEALSGGQRQRVWIAMALAQETGIIFLDEPTTYLDMAHQLEVLELLENLNRQEKRTIIMVLHDLNQASRFADYIIAMRSGEIIKSGAPDEIMDKEVLKKVFQIEAVIGKDPQTEKPICLTYNLLKGQEDILNHDKEKLLAVQ